MSIVTRELASIVDSVQASRRELIAKGAAGLGACGSMPWFQAPHGVPWLLAQHSVAWCALWLACGGFAAVFLMPLLPRSTKAHENHPCYVGQKLAIYVKVVLVGGLANVVLYDLHGLPAETSYNGYRPIEIAGVLFAASEISDLVMSGCFGFLDMEHIVHHLIHIILGLLIRGECAPAYTAAVLMAQETSGLFLNYYLLMRHRAPSHPTVVLAQALFAVAFFIWRLGIGTYGTYDFLVQARDHLPPAFPAWKATALGTALVAASALQWYWGVFIVKSVARKLLPAPKKAA